MIRISKFIFSAFFILLGVFSYAEAAKDAPPEIVHLLDLNVQAHSQLTPGNIGGKYFVSHILKNNYDFVTTQEAETNTLPLINPTFGAMGNSYGMSGPNKDATIYFKNDPQTGWTDLGRYKELIITPDVMTNKTFGQRIAALSQFKSNSSGRVITVVSTHYCVVWTQPGGPNSNGCNASAAPGKSQNWVAHVSDSLAIANEVSSFSGGSPVIFTGDFNSVDDPVNQARDIQNNLLTKGLLLINYGANPLPKSYGNTIDFVYFSGLTQIGLAFIYQMDQNVQHTDANRSDHDGVDVTFSIGGTPPPPTDCQVPTRFGVEKNVPDASSITITWSGVANATGYNIYDFEGKLLNKDGPLTKPSYQDDTTPSLKAGQQGTYDYKAQSICKTGSSAISAVYPAKVTGG